MPLEEIITPKEIAEMNRMFEVLAATMPPPIMADEAFERDWAAVKTRLHLTHE
jgi:hypothetical protein